MKIVFASNYFNHHQKAFCNALYKQLGDDFAFVATTVMREERRAMGYADIDVPGYVIDLNGANADCIDRAKRLIIDADVIISGSVPTVMLRERILSGKLTFRYTERPFKKSPSFLNWCSFGMKSIIKYFPYRNVYLLCASAFAASDYGSCGLFQNSAYKWGYFPETSRYNIRGIQSKKKRAQILWCGRFLHWKHPDDAIKVAYRLKTEGYDFELDFIGSGEKENELKGMAADMGLQDCVRFLGTMNPERVRNHMETAGIYLFTSDRNEGWGAVLNESMNSGCAVVASDAIGSVPYLVKDGQNGFTYCSGDLEMMYEKVKYLLDHPIEQQRLGIAAYETILNEWNAEVAAERFLNLAQQILEGNMHPNLYESGPCSRA